MGDLTFNNTPTDIHHCTSHQQGDWITWRCPHCSGYERRLNWRTGEMSIQRGGSEAQHVGISTQPNNMEGLTKGLTQN
jgi:DnaJ-class molecular chaperone